MKRAVDLESITVYTRAWRDEDGNPQQATIGAAVFINGVELQCALGASIKLDGVDFTHGTIEVAPVKWSIVTLNEDEWQERFGRSR